MADNNSIPIDSINKTFRIGSVLNESFAAYFGNFIKFFVFALILFIPVTGIVGGLIYAGLFEVGNRGSLGISPLIVVSGFVIAFLYMLTAYLIQIGVVSATIKYNSGRVISFSTMFERGVENIAGAMGITIILVVAMVGVLMIAGLVTNVIVSSMGIGLVGIFIGVLAFIIMIAIMIGASIAIPVFIAEQKGVFKSLKRSFHLSKGRKWEMLAIFMVAGILYTIVAVILQLLSGFGGAIAVFASQMLTYVFSTSFSAAVVAVVYTNLRASKEGVGTSEIAKVFE